MSLYIEFAVYSNFGVRGIVWPSRQGRGMVMKYGECCTYNVGTMEVSETGLCIGFCRASFRDHPSTSAASYKDQNDP